MHPVFKLEQGLYSEGGMSYIKYLRRLQPSELDISEYHSSAGSRCTVYLHLRIPEATLDHLAGELQMSPTDLVREITGNCYAKPESVIISSEVGSAGYRLGKDPRWTPEEKQAKLDAKMAEKVVQVWEGNGPWSEQEDIVLDLLNNRLIEFTTQHNRMVIDEGVTWAARGAADWAKKHHPDADGELMLAEVEKDLSELRAKRVEIRTALDARYRERATKEVLSDENIAEEVKVAVVERLKKASQSNDFGHEW